LTVGKYVPVKMGFANSVSYADCLKTRCPIKAFAIILLVCFLLAALGVFPAAAGQKIPEKLVYDLSWTGIPVGTAEQEISDQGETVKIVSFARSNDWLSTFFPVDDRTETVLDKEGPFPGRPRVFKMLFKEGRRVRDREIRFHPQEMNAQFLDHEKGEQVQVPVEPETFDIYSSFYYVRHQPLKLGSSIYINVLDSKKLHRIEIRVLRRERIKVPAGEFDTLVIEPMVKPQGVFEGKRGLYIWLTDDERRIPVKAQTKVTVGSVTAVLAGGNY
jgi:hypothetical protein